MDWLNPPPHWNLADGVLDVVTGERTDFWRETHYGFIRDDGHLYGERVTGDFTAEAEVWGDYGTLYDQAGLMLRIDERTWIKAGVEFVDARRTLSVVVTRDFSDWSTVPVLDAPNPVRLRVSRHGTAIRVEWAASASDRYGMLRLAYLPEAGTAMVGPMCCSPQRAGFRARFTGFRVGAPISRDLHA